MRSGGIIAIGLSMLCFASSSAQTLNLSFDLLGINSASETLAASLERTMIELQKLEGVANSHVEQRLVQIRSIVNDAMTGAQATIDLATARMLTLEGQVNSDAVNLIYQVQCATNNVLNEQLQRAFANLILTLKKADPTLTILGYRIVNVETNEVIIDNANDAYVTTKAAAVTALKRMDDKTDAYRIVFTYQNLEKAAMYTRCAYNGQLSSQVIFTKEANDWERLSAPWVSIVTPKI
jgi:hypothetical protein